MNRVGVPSTWPEARPLSTSRRTRSATARHRHTIIHTDGVSTGFMLSGAALIVIGLVAALALHRAKGRGDTTEHLTDAARQQPAELISLTTP